MVDSAVRQTRTFRGTRKLWHCPRYDQCERLATRPALAFQVLRSRLARATQW